MINLIPPDARKAVTKEYWLRVATVWLWLIASAFFIVAILHFPSYVLVQSQLMVFEDQYTRAQDRQGEFKRSEEEITNTNALVAHVAPAATTTPYSVYLDELDTLAKNGIELSQFNFTVAADYSVESISITGIARDRASLTSFSDVVETHPLFTEAQIPIANLASDKNINFNITVVTSNKTGQ